MLSLFSYSRSCPCGSLLLVFVFILNSAPSFGGQLFAGAAKVDITPAMGVSLDGSISKNGPATSVHDPLHARAIVLASGEARLAIVVVDQCMTAGEVFDEAKEQIHEEIGIPPVRLLMAATHTHAAPRTIHIGRTRLDDEYHHQLSDWIAQAVIEAERNLAPAEVGFASFPLPDLVACRRFLCEPGSVGSNPFGDPGDRIKSVAGSSTQIIRPAGPVDPEFSVLSLRHLDGTPLCLLGNFSVHYCGGYRRGAVSADYFGRFSAAVEALLANETTHPPVIGIMSNGTSGDTGSFQRGSLKKFEPFEAMEYFGRMLAEKAVAAAKDAKYERVVDLEITESQLELAIRCPDDDRVKWAEELLADPEARHPHRWSKIYAEEAMHLASSPETERLKLQAIRIGPIGIAAAPCEVFAVTGLAIKQASPIEHTFVMELANGYGGYLPTRRQHKLGGYETWPARSSKLEIGAEEKIRQELIRLLQSVSP